VRYLGATLPRRSFFASLDSNRQKGDIVAIRLGPVLNFRGCADQSWKVSVLIAADDQKAPQLHIDVGSASPPKELGNVKAERGTLTLWRFDLALPLVPQESSATYWFSDDQKWKIALPASGASPRMAYGSCNGFSSLKLLKNTKDPNALWRDVAEKHAKLPFHLLLLGGDQVYSDAIWEELRELAVWASLPTEQGVKKKPSAKLAKEIKEYYEELYPRRWKQPEPAKAFATIPTVMMWDDHVQGPV
jgi:hypothetical protein